MDIFYSICLGILGAVFGSFLACMGYRIPNKIKTTYPSSFCSNCNKSLKWFMNIPILSYILLGGKCFYCKKKIGFIYFFCEILCSFLFVLSYNLFGISLEFFLSIILSCALIVTIVSDFLYYYISDRVLIFSCIGIFISMMFYLEPMDILIRVISGIILFLVMIGIKIMGNSVFKRESLGDGDIKLMGVIGLSIGLLNSFISLFFASVLALIFSLITLKKNKEGLVPFGPFLLLGALLVLFLTDVINPYITSLFSL
ncbi:MAG: prepilin peptidase [Bacilli bacterium]